MLIYCTDNMNIPKGTVFAFLFIGKIENVIKKEKHTLYAVRRT